MAQRSPVRAQQSAPAEVLASLNLGYNTYTDPTLQTPRQWAAASNVYSGAYGFVQRARFANLVSQAQGNWTNQNQPFTTLKFFALPGLSNYLLGDNNGKFFSFDTGASYARTQRFNPYYDPTGSGTADTTPAPSLAGPFSREVLQNIVYEMNGAIKMAGRLANAATIEGFGLDAPDSSLQITISSGDSKALTNIRRQNGIVTATTAALVVGFSNQNGVINVTLVSDISFNGTFGGVQVSGAGPFTYTWPQAGFDTALIVGSGNLTTQITKSVGRSYAYAFENANKNHVSAPSPATQFVLYNLQFGTLFAQEPGTIASAGTTVTGTNTQFSQAWVGRSIMTIGGGVNTASRILSVQSTTQLTVATSLGVFPTLNFLVYDPQTTHIRFYATADGGATYFRIARNAFAPTAGSAFGQGISYLDVANSEPPNFPFTTEVSQLFNVPPPVGAFIKEYQSRLLIYGGTIPGQTFFFTNIESTTVGLTQESVAPLNQVTLPIQNANISGMADLPGSLIIWSDKQDMFRLTGLLSDNTPLGLGAANTAVGLGTQITSLPYSLGCANPFSVAVTPLGAIWVTSNRELWLYTDKYAPRNIGRPVQNILRNIPLNQLANVRLTYYHSLDRNWVSIALSNGASNNVLVSLDLDLLASNGQASFFTFDMATNHPAFWVFNINCNSLEVLYETGGAVRMVVGSTDLIQDADYQTGLFGTETIVAGAGFTLQPWGNDSAFMIKRPTWLRFTTNQDPSTLANSTAVAIATIARVTNTVTVTTATPHGLSPNNTAFVSGVAGLNFPAGAFTVQATPTPTTFTYIQVGANASSTGGTVASGWSFGALGIDDDFYTFASPLSLSLIPGVNDSSSLCGNPNLSSGAPFRHSPELFKIGGVNFVMGRRIQFVVNFPSGTGVNYALRSIQLGFGPSPPR
jgi:hypothetical protein